MLSQHDRRTLADIEEHLSANEPELARRLEQLRASMPPPSAPKNATPHHVREAVGLSRLILGAALLAMAFAARSADLALLGVVLLAADTALWAAVRIAAHFGSRR